MIRVIYRWRVAADERDDRERWEAFRKAPSVDPDATAALRRVTAESEVVGLFDELAELTEPTRR